MTHLSYIAASYGLALAVGGFYSFSAWIRMRRVRARLEAVDPRAR